jgi:hypothetical protein
MKTSVFVLMLEDMLVPNKNYELSDHPFKRCIILFLMDVILLRYIPLYFSTRPSLAGLLSLQYLISELSRHPEDELHHVRELYVNINMFPS